MSDLRPDAIRTYLQTWVPHIEKRLAALLPLEDVEPRVVHTAMRYSVLGGGKRLRPALVLIGAHAAGGAEEDVLDLSCAVEFIHTYSLIHDDLPSMDDDATRRGRPSCHMKFGEAMAILAGDALNTFAFEVIARHAPDPSRAAKLVLDMCLAAGTAGMVGGQAADLEGEQPDGGPAPREDAVRSIHERKTGALLGASLCLGARACGADDELVDALRDCGRGLGLAFQIVDDVLDEEGTEGELGKTPGKDRAQGKATYPAAIGVAASRERAATVVDDAIAGLPAGSVRELLGSLGAEILERRT